MNNNIYSLDDIKEGIRSIEAQLEYGYLDLGCAGMDDLEMAVVREAIDDYKKKVEACERPFWEDAMAIMNDMTNAQVEEAIKYLESRRNRKAASNACEAMCMED